MQGKTESWVNLSLASKLIPVWVKHVQEWQQVPAQCQESLTRDDLVQWLMFIGLRMQFSQMDRVDFGWDCGPNVSHKNWYCVNVATSTSSFDPKLQLELAKALAILCPTAHPTHAPTRKSHILSRTPSVAAFGDIYWELELRKGFKWFSIFSNGEQKW
jgi:hypothetical protein